MTKKTIKKEKYKVGGLVEFTRDFRAMDMTDLNHFDIKKGWNGIVIGIDGILKKINVQNRSGIISPGEYLINAYDDGSFKKKSALSVSEKAIGKRESKADSPIMTSERKSIVLEAKTKTKKEIGAGAFFILLSAVGVLLVILSFMNPDVFEKASSGIGIAFSILVLGLGTFVSFVGGIYYFINTEDD